MKSLRNTLVVAGLLTLAVSTLSAQSSRIKCKDGSKASVGHFSCWGHGGVVRQQGEASPKSEVKAASKAAKKERVAKKSKTASKKHVRAEATTHTKTAKKSGKKTPEKASEKRPVKHSAK